MSYCENTGTRPSLREFVIWVTFYGDQFRKKHKMDAYAPIGGMDEFTDYLRSVGDDAYPKAATDKTNNVLRGVAHHRIDQYKYAGSDALLVDSSWVSLMAKQLGQFAHCSTYPNREKRIEAAYSLAALCVGYIENDYARTEKKDLGLGERIDDVAADLAKAGVA
jgi:hypothetical protein